ncbi:MAG TPA: type IV toxin-antitoxin system AbiEi family antitoxin domain-containing protein, partial [Arthrobacter sp.]|nr:type IV toxin-antitoxin system AbiEi family antitoxin domain-containing protein [Arthrobacter sp.]
MNPTEILRSAGGVLLTRDVLASGATETDLRRAVRSGEVVRLERGLLALRALIRSWWPQGVPAASLHACQPPRHSASGSFGPRRGLTIGGATAATPCGVSAIGFHSRSFPA